MAAISPISPIHDITLDHVAVAMEQQAAAWPRYAGELPSRWIGGGATAGFSSAQVEYANGMRVEVLEPYAVGMNDFLRRFLDRNGPGPHHLTFKVKDIATALRRVEHAGYQPVGIDLQSDWWKEAFIHPKDAPGIVVQLAQSMEGGDWGGDRTTPAWFPAPRVDEHAALVHVTHSVADIDEGLRLFRDLLNGTPVSDATADGIRYVDLAWPGPGRVRLVSGDALAPWIGGRAGRVHHVAFVTQAPEDVRDAVRHGDVHVVEPTDNLGVRLVLADTEGPFGEHPLGYAPPELAE